MAGFKDKKHSLKSRIQISESKRRDGYINTQGYKCFKRLGKEVNVHRATWEKHHGEIPKGMIIHHINGDKLDNRINNLEMLSVAEHTRHHKTGASWRWSR